MINKSNPGFDKDSEEYKRAKEEHYKRMLKLFGPERIAKMSKVPPLPNSLPNRGIFSHFDFYKANDNEDPLLSHVRMFTKCGNSISLSSLTRLCLIGKDKLDNPQFERSTKPYLKGIAVLAGRQCVSPEIMEWVKKNGFKSQRQVAKALVGKSFTATPVEVGYYYPSEGYGIKNECVDDINNSSNTHIKSHITRKTLYRVVLD